MASWHLRERWSCHPAFWLERPEGRAGGSHSSRTTLQEGAEAQPVCPQVGECETGMLGGGGGGGAGSGGSEGKTRGTRPSRAAGGQGQGTCRSSLWGCSICTASQRSPERTAPGSGERSPLGLQEETGQGRRHCAQPEQPRGGTGRPRGGGTARSFKCFGYKLWHSLMKETERFPTSVC